MIGSLLLAAKPSPYGSGVVGGAGVQAKAADAFRATMAVNVHMDATPYTSNFSLVVKLVRSMALQYIRSGTFGSGSDVAIGLTAILAREAGVKFILVLNKGASYTDTSIEDYMMSKLDPSVVWAFEGFNEVDNNNGSWGGDPGYFTNVVTRFHATRLWRDGHASSVVRAIPLTTPTVTSNYGATHSGLTLDCSADADIGASHPYPGASEPGAPLNAAITAVKPIWGSLTRLVVTETGWETAPGATTPSYLVGQGASQLAVAKYMGRLFGEYDEYGIEKTAPYELMDDGVDATNGEANFGWTGSDGTFKQSATLIQNLNALLGDSVWTPPVYTPGTKRVQAVFTHANQSGWPNATGTDTNLTWVDGDGNETVNWSIVSNHGVCLATSQVRQLIGDSHSGDSMVYAEPRGFRASYSNLVRLYARWSGLSVNYSCDYNPGVSNQFSINKNGSSVNLAAMTNSAWSTLTAPNLRMLVTTVGNDNYIYAKVWDSAGAEPSDWTIMTVDLGGATGALAAGSEAIWVDNNSSGNQIYFTDYWAAPVTTTAGSWSTATVTPGKLDYTLSGTLTNVHQRLWQKSDGSFWLVLWNRVSSWNAGSATDITNAPVTATLTLNSGGAKTVTTYLPRLTTSPSASLGSHTSFTLSIPDELYLVRLA